MRGLLHMNIHHSIEEKREVLEDFTQKLCDSGHGHSTRMEIIKSSKKKYYSQVLIQESGGRRLYRSAGEMAESRRLKSLLTKTWFKSFRAGLGVKTRW